MRSKIPEEFTAVHERFRTTRTRRPGPLVVFGRGTSGNFQQLLCEPARDTRGRHTRFEVMEPTPGEELSPTRLVIGKTALYRLTYSRRGNEVARHLAMGTVSTRKLGRMCQFATTSNAGAEIANALKRQPTLAYVAADVPPELDRFGTRGITSAVVNGVVDHLNPSGPTQMGISELLLHRPYGEGKVKRAPTYETVIPHNFAPGLGHGCSSYEGPNGTAFDGHVYKDFPLWSTIEETAAHYQDYFGRMSMVNVAVRELIGIVEPQAGVYDDLAVRNAIDFSS